MHLPQKAFLSKAQKEAFEKSFKGKYLAAIKRNSFLYFGVPFFIIMLFGTHLATEFSALRYEQHDRRQSEVTQEQQLSLSGKKRKVDLKDEYYRLQKLDIDNWEQKRVPRLEGESENKW